LPEGAASLIEQLTGKELLERILIELKIMNLHLKSITEEEIGEVNAN
jgi:hypothetical protein